MATKTTRVCDIYGGTHKVRKYRLSLTEIAGDEPADTDVELAGSRIDLCLKALKRLQSFMRRGTTPPKAAEEKSSDVEGQTTLDEIG